MLKRAIFSAFFLSIMMLSPSFLMAQDFAVYDANGEFPGDSATFGGRNTTNNIRTEFMRITNNPGGPSMWISPNILLGTIGASGQPSLTTVLAGKQAASSILTQFASLPMDADSVMWINSSGLLTSGSVATFKGYLGLGDVASSNDYLDLDNKPDLSGYATTSALSSFTPSALSANGSNCTAGQYARGVDASGNAENCTAVPVDAFVVGAPNSRSVSLDTAYQCTDDTKPCSFTITTACPMTAALSSSASCAGEIRIGSANTVASGASGTVIAPLGGSVSGLSDALTQTFSDNETVSIKLPAGWYLAVRQPSGSGLTVQAAFDQSLSN